MHSIKGTWVGQTFALAKCNESEGRKTRIRRSKEERKSMVQAFIEKYQTANQGNFPSLNLTHKEVGGSFYTVREIVRDLIQENRVLGPGKLEVEDKGIDQLLKQDLFYSNSSDPQSFLTISSIGFHIQPTDLQVSNGVPVSQESIINGNQTVVTENNSVLVYTESLLNESIEAVEHSEGLHRTMATDILLEKEKNSEKLVADTTIETNLIVEKEKNGEEEFIATKTKENPGVLDVVVEPEENAEIKSEVTMERITPIVADVVVNNFPLKIDTGTTDILDQSSEEVMKMTDSFDEIASTELGKKDEKYETEISSAEASGLIDAETMRTLVSPSLEQSSELVKEATQKDYGNLPIKRLDGSFLKEGIEYEKSGRDKHFQVKVVENDILPPKSFVQGQATDKSKVVNGLSTSPVEPKADIHHSNESEKETSPTLDRINLESWESKSKNPAQDEPNPVLALFKAFLSALDKFWSDFSRL